MNAIKVPYLHAALFISHKVGLYEFLGNHHRSAAEVSQRTKLAPRAALALLSASSALGFVAANAKGFRLTQTGKDYLLADSPTYRGPQIEWKVKFAAAESYENIERSVLSNSPHGMEGAEWAKLQTEQADFAREFTSMMHAQGIAPALAWPDKVDLSRARTMLDVGGGSGVHAIGAALRWKRLSATVFEISSVCEVAAQYAKQYGVAARVKARAGDMWKDPFPAADVHFYSQIYHDWSDDKCRELTAKSFSSLKPGGRIIIHELFYNDSRTGPVGAATMEMVMMVWTTGRQFTGREIGTMLREAGFGKVLVKRTFGDWSIVTGVKP
jgi:SAM-dependent methyltransferase